MLLRATLASTTLLAAHEIGHTHGGKSTTSLALAALYLPVNNRASTRQQTCSHRIGGPKNMAATKCKNRYNAGY